MLHFTFRIVYIFSDNGGWFCVYMYLFLFLIAEEIIKLIMIINNDNNNER